MKILLTGATGFLGRHLSKRLKERGDEITHVSSKNCDLTDADSLSQFDAIQFDQIYHLAAWTQAGDFCLRHPGEQWIINQKINTHVLSWWQAKQPQAKLICMGTSCGYSPEFPLEEQYYLQGEPIESLYTYAMTKRMLLCGCQALHKQFGLNYLYLIPSTLYGPGYHTDSRQLHFIFDLIRKILRGHYFNEPVVLWGDGKQKRELVHVDDFLGTMLNLESESNTLINIGAGEEYSIIEFAKRICKSVGYPFEKIEFDRTKYVGARSKVLSVAKLKQFVPEPAFCPLEEGLEQTVEWFRAQFFPQEQTQELNAPTHKSETVPG